MARLYYAPTKNAIQKTLSAQLLSGATSSASLSNTDGIPNNPGIMVIDRVDANGAATASKREYIAYTGTSGSTVTGLTRNVDGGGTDQDHEVGAVVEFVPDVTWASSIQDAIETLMDTSDTTSIKAGLTIPTPNISLGAISASGATITTIKNEDDMASDDDTALATQGSIKTYVDNNGSKDFINRQAIINGGFQINQRVYTSSGTLAAGEYGHDRWKAGAGGGDYTFTQLDGPTQITIESGKSLIQVIEDKNVVGGTYTLSWTGTAQARAGVDSDTPSGSYSSSPLTISSQSAGTVMSVEFNEGTLGEVQLNSGSTALNFNPKTYGQELSSCQRYYEKGSVGHRGSELGWQLNVRNNSASNKYIYWSIPYKVTKRDTPTVTYVSGTTGAFESGTNTDRWATPSVLTPGGNLTEQISAYIQDNTNFSTTDIISVAFQWTADAEL